MKRLHHEGKEARLYFYRDSNQVEAGLLEETAAGLLLTEIKATRTYRDKLLDNLRKLEKAAGLPVRKQLVFGGEEGFSVQDVEVLPWHNPVGG